MLHESGERLHLKEQLLVGEANFLFADHPEIIIFSDGLGLLSKVARIEHFKVAM